MNKVVESHLDRGFASFLAGRSGLEGEKRDSFHDLVMRLSRALGEGHSCIELNKVEQELVSSLDLVAVRDDEQNGTMAPLVLHGDNLYLERYFSYEQRLARQIRTFAAARFELQPDKATAALLFEDEPDPNNDQLRAAYAVLTRALIIVNGGPGTGKTTTVVKMLALLLASDTRPLHIGLAAPTGKAAMRLSESIGNSLAHLVLPEEVYDGIPTEAMTLHRMLGVRSHSPQFRHNSDNPLAFDVVVVDEASMVDLALMSKLVDALKPGSRLILLGDRDQLASVESGAVLGDLIHSLADSSVELKKTYRFDASIKALAEGINAGREQDVWQLLEDEKRENVARLDAGSLYPYLVSRYGQYLGFVQEESNPDTERILEIFTRFQRFQVLCGVAFSDYGVIAVNRRVEQGLASRGFDCRMGEWYPGRPVLVTRNDYGLDLYNGDIGICLWDREKKGLRVWFERPDGSLKSCAINLLPAFETVYAMTIHKSQGSEFEEVVVVLPNEDNRVLSRELIYTAVTRAKAEVKIVADHAVLGLALLRRLKRHSGLRGMLC